MHQSGLKHLRSDFAASKLGRGSLAHDSIGGLDGDHGFGIGMAIPAGIFLAAIQTKTARQVN